ncbi:MAG: nucleoside triphosphate pyrophosphohydrolase [Pseudomonadota bacterium]
MARRRDITALLEVMRRLRDPDGGCPWDLEQDFASVAPYTVEEAYEVADAIARQDMADLADELGDLLLQVVFHAQMAREAGHFSFDDVVAAIVDKMIRRHPHVFGSDAVVDAAAQTEAWEAIKAAERRAQFDDKSALAGVARGLAPLTRAAKLQRRAARVGFDWPDVAGPLAKLTEETAELEAAAAELDRDAMESELGDLLFSCVNVARHLEIDPGRALAGASARFEARFRHMESRATAALETLDELALDALWEQAKEDGAR